MDSLQNSTFGTTIPNQDGGPKESSGADTGTPHPTRAARNAGKRIRRQNRKLEAKMRKLTLVEPVADQNAAGNLDNHTGNTYNLRSRAIKTPADRSYGVNLNNYRRGQDSELDALIDYNVRVAVFKAREEMGRKIRDLEKQLQMDRDLGRVVHEPEMRTRFSPIDEDMEVDAKKDVQEDPSTENHHDRRMSGNQRMSDARKAFRARQEILQELLEHKTKNM